jgi:hypothetical protein
MLLLMQGRNIILLYAKKSKGLLLYVYVYTVASINNKLTTVCFMIRLVRPYISSSSLVKIYHSLFNSLSSYGIKFWGQATNTKKLFLTQKRAVRLITGYGNWFSCRNHWSHNISIQSYCLFQKQKPFHHKLDTHNLKTRQSNNLYLPTSTLTLYQKGVYFTGVKLFNKLPHEIKETAVSPKQFKVSLRRYLVTHCFYDLEEYYSVNE